MKNTFENFVSAWKGRDNEKSKELMLTICEETPLSDWEKMFRQNSISALAAADVFWTLGLHRCPQGSTVRTIFQRAIRHTLASIPKKPMEAGKGKTVDLEALSNRLKMPLDDFLADICEIYNVEVVKC